MIQAARGATKQAMANTTLIVLKPVHEIIAILRNPETSGLDYLTADAVQSKNHKYIQFLIESLIGKPNQTQDIELTSNSRGLENLSQEQLNKLLVLGESGS